MSEVAQTVINEVYDAINDKTAYIALGTVKRVNIKRINEDGSPKITNITKGPNAGKSIKSTHRVSILLEQGQDPVWISFGEEEIRDLKYEGNFQIKEAEKTYTNILPGMVLRLPVDRQEYKSKKTGEDVVSFQGKKKNIVIKDRSNAQQGQSGAASGSAGTSGGSGATGKVYGEILSLDGPVASVKGDKGEWKVTLSDEQLGQVQVGGRLAGTIDASGAITVGFKVYGPVGARSGGTGGAGSFKKDDLPIRIGNAVSIVHAMFPSKPVTNLRTEIVQTVAVMDGLRAKLGAEFTNMDAYSIGARLGQSGIVAAPHGSESPAAFSGLVEDTFRLICSIEDEMRAAQATPATPDSKPVEQTKQERTTAIKEPEQQPRQDYTPPPVDFDEDIPF